MWVDDAAATVGVVLEHQVKVLPKLSGETVMSVFTSELFSVVSTDTGQLHWW